MQQWDEMLSRVNQENSFMRHNGIRAVSVSTEQAVTETEVDERSLNPYRIAHGGLYFTMMDIAAGMAARADGRRYVTLNCSTNFHKPAQPGTALRAVGRVTQRSRGVCVVEAEVRGTADQLLYASGSFCMYCTER